MVGRAHRCVPKSSDDETLQKMQSDSAIRGISPGTKGQRRKGSDLPPLLPCQPKQGKTQRIAIGVPVKEQRAGESERCFPPRKDNQTEQVLSVQDAGTQPSLGRSSCGLQPAVDGNLAVSSMSRLGELKVGVRRGRPRIGEPHVKHEPWLAANMSRATWYRRKAEARGGKS